MESHHDLISLFEHDLFGKPVPTFPDHALAAALVRLSLIGAHAKAIRTPTGTPLCDDVAELLFAAPVSRSHCRPTTYLQLS